MSASVPPPRARIALVNQGDPTSSRSWSGVPVGLASGLTEAGCEVVPIDASFPAAARIAHRLGMSWVDRSASRAFAAACGATASRRLRSSGPLDGAIAIGSGYVLSTDVPFVTFEDMTVAQALSRSDPAYESLSETGARRWRARQRLIYERSRACCVTSNWAGESVREDYGIAAAKVRVVGFGHNIDVGKVDRDWSTPRFLFVGADWERKRGPAVLAAFEQVRKRHPDATLDLVGGHPPVSADGVTGHGSLPLGSEEARHRYCELVREATCFLMPSNYEPFGIAYVDVATSGVPSIGTTVGGAPDAIGDGGRVVDPADQAALVAAMLELSDPDTARLLGERAYERSSLFTWRAVAERLLRALRPPGVETGGLADFLAPGGPAEASG